MALRTCRHLFTRAVARESKAPRLCGLCIILSADGLSTGNHYFITILGIVQVSDRDSFSLLNSTFCQSKWNLPDTGPCSALR